MRTTIKVAILLMLVVLSVFGSACAKFWVTWNSSVTLNVIPFEDDEPPVIKNVRHEPLYPNTTDIVYFYANVTDNVGVAFVQLNYTENGGITWQLKNMTIIENSTTYMTSLGPYPLENQILGFYVVAYDFAGNVAFGSEIVPSLPEPPKIAPIVISDEIPNPLPKGKDISYNITSGGSEIYANVTEMGIYEPGLAYNISYSIDGGLTWVNQSMTYVNGFIWKYLINATTNILFRIVASDESTQSKVYWIIVAPWKYPVYLYFATNEQYFPVAGLDFDGDSNVSNNWISYQNDPSRYVNEFMNNDIDNDGTIDVWSYTYMNPKTLDDGCLVIEYWIYYAFNRYPILDEVLRDDHEHDFESVYLWIDLSTGNIKKLGCTQHKWVNHYIFNVSDPPPRINLAVESGGHGMALLKDDDNDGYPDLNYFGYYSIVPGVDPLGREESFVPAFLNPFVINPESFVAQLHPWIIYDPRIPSTELHLFDNTSILTNALSLDAISPLLPSVVSQIPQYYGFLTDLLTATCVLKTTFGAPVPLSSNLKLIFHVTSPLFKQEFRDPGKFWWKVSFGWWIAKKAVLLAINRFVARGLLTYFKKAAQLGYIASGFIGHVTSNVLNVVFDPAQGSVKDLQGHVLGYSDVYNNLPRGLVFATRNTTNNLYDLFLIMTNRTSSYIYDIQGFQNDGTYNFTVSCIDADGNSLGFNASDIPIHSSEIHRYVINWSMLETEDFGVEVYVDQNGDGIFEYMFLSDSKLTAEEFSQMIPWEISLIGLSRHPIVDFAVYNEKLYATADNMLYVYDGNGWNIVNTPTFVGSLETCQNKLVIGGKSGLYSFNGTTFNLIFPVPTYIKSLGVYNNTFYAGIQLDKPPTLYFCNGSVDNPDDWHIDTDFSALLNFSGPFRSIDSFAVYNDKMYVGSGGAVYCFNGTNWSIATSYDDVYAFLDMQVYNGKLYLATRDQAWRKPYYQGGTGFSGRVIEFDGDNWTTVLDHDYWIYSLETYHGRLYAGTANKIFEYNMTDWNISFNSSNDLAQYAISFEVYNDTLYAGMGNGYIYQYHDPTSLVTIHVQDSSGNPVVTKVSIYKGTGEFVASGWTNDDGDYKICLANGEYYTFATDPYTGNPTPKEYFTVPENTYVEIIIDSSSGENSSTTTTKNQIDMRITEIPEFPATTILPLIILLSVIAVVFAKKKN